MTLKSLAFGFGLELKYISPRRRARLLKIGKPSKGDTFMCSFPRSGNTWTRMIVAALLLPELKNVDLDVIDDAVPDIGKGSLSQPKPRVFKNHSPDFSLFSKVIYNYRDGRDCLISNYKYTKNITNYSEPIERYVTDRRAHPFGFWFEHIQKALQFQLNYPDRILMLRYEHIKSQPEREISRIAEFLNTGVSSRRIQEIINMTDINNQKKLRSSYDDPRKKFTIQKGVVGAWRDTLPDDALSVFENLSFRELNALGYPLVNARNAL